MRKWTTICIFVIYGHLLVGQEILTLNDAIIIGLENNLDLKILKKNNEVSFINNQYINIGFYPQIALNFGRNFNNNNTRQEFFSGQIREGNNVKSNNLTSNIQASWRLFDGMNMFVTRDIIKAQLNRSSHILSVQAEMTVFTIVNAYLNIMLQNQRLITLQEGIQLSNERLKLAQIRKDVGRTSDLEILQAKVDLQTDSAALVNQINLITTLKIQFNQLLGRTPQYDFDIEKEYNSIIELSTYDEYEKKALTMHPIIALADEDIALADMMIKGVESNKWPVLDLNLGLNFQQSEAEIGVLKFNRNLGLAYGITGRWDIFQGGDLKRRTQIAKVNRDVALLTKEQITLNIKTQLYTAYTNYLSARELINFESQNLSIAQKNFDINTEKLRIGTSTAIELRESQLNLVETRFRYLTSLHQVRLAEIQLLQWTGGLINTTGM